MIQFLETRHVFPISNYYYKPLYHALLSAFYLVVPNAGYNGLLYWSALFGSATVLTMFLLARQLWEDELAALAAALFMAASGYHIIWSRSGYAQTAAMFVFCLTLIAYLSSLRFPDGRSKRFLGWVTGFGLGATFAIHPSSVPYLLVVGFVAIYAFLKQGKWRALARQMIPLLGGALICLVIVEASLTYFLVVLGDNLSWLFTDDRPFMTFFEQLWKVRHRSLSPSGFFYGFRSKISAYGIQPFLYGEGLVVSALAVVGTAMVARRWWKGRRPEELLVLFGLGFPFLFYFVFASKLPYPRNVAYVSIFVALSGGIAAAEAIRRWRLGSFVLALALAAFFLIQGAHIGYLYRVRSGYKDAAHWLRERGEKAIVTHRRPALWEAHGTKAYLPLARNHTNDRNAIYLKRWGQTRRVELLDLPLYYATSETQYRKPERLAFMATYLPGQNPVAVFPNTDPFTAKRMELLDLALKVCTNLALPCPADRVRREREISEEVIWNNSIKLYRLPTNGAKAHSWTLPILETKLAFPGKTGYVERRVVQQSLS
ncbi:glycosyltransferase family 39 protein [Nitrospinae bacterium AH_259_B05_G02_I21]|nr:glycosyltransferase family 39 protein [Nitrospinae bacterium AH_259_B05_G02_I21]